MSRRNSNAENPGIIEKAKRKISDTAHKAKEVAIAAKDALYGGEEEKDETRTFHIPVDESVSNEKEEYSHYILDSFKEVSEADKGRKLPAFR
uniref:Uncharacterized protein n=1 Tax=Acrobeloides nanus TaxID=290746 RepID=A0A914C3F6_9BILA